MHMREFNITLVLLSPEKPCIHATLILVIFPRYTVLLGTYTMRICKEILKISTFVGIFCMFCPLWTCILQFYVSLNCYMPKCVSYFPFSCGTLQKSKNWFDVLNFGFSHIHGYSGSTVIRDSRVPE